MTKSCFSKPFSRMLAYMLGRRPDEFGLVPDPGGFVKIKELLKAFSEEDGWRHVSRASINQLVMTEPEPPVEVLDNRIRAVDRSRLTPPAPAHHPPKLLYTCVRRRAYSHVDQQGIAPAGYPSVVLAAGPEMALRLGRRFDPDPVLLTVQVRKAMAAGAAFLQAGEQLFLADGIAAGCFSGPPLPKPPKEAAAREPQSDEKRRGLAGSFIVEVDPQTGIGGAGRSLRKRDPQWKKERKRGRNPKRDREAPPWRQ
ncbi:MAG: RNA 2'-phosphotransferase [Desulfobacterales bacterium]|nr:RNA 2'-phosphotransferase [Desulfobacterales bacterium]